MRENKITSANVLDQWKVLYVYILFLYQYLKNVLIFFTERMYM